MSGYWLSALIPRSAAKELSMFLPSRPFTVKVSALSCVEYSPVLHESHVAGAGVVRGPKKRVAAAAAPITACFAFSHHGRDAILRPPAPASGEAPG